MGNTVLKSSQFNLTSSTLEPSQFNVVPSTLELENERGTRKFQSGPFLCSKPLVLGGDLLEGSAWSAFWTNLWDFLFPKRLPPLKLTSQPIAVADPMAFKRSPASSVLSFITHAGLISLVLWMAWQAHLHRVPPKETVVTPIEFQPYVPVSMPVPKPLDGGGGGGAHQIIEADKGHLPAVEKVQTAPPQVLRIDNPKVAAQPSVEMPQHLNIADNTLPIVGDPQSAQVALASQGAGSNSGFGHGLGGGIGSGGGAGVGSGSNGGYGGGVMTPGGGVSAPQLIHSVEPEFTEEARQAKYQGAVSLALIIDAQGNPVDIQVVRHLGMGLDQKAIDAVRQYKFKPGLFQGHPVAVRLVIDVNFHLY